MSVNATPYINIKLLFRKKIEAKEFNSHKWCENIYKKRKLDVCLTTRTWSLITLIYSDRYANMQSYIWTLSGRKASIIERIYWGDSDLWITVLKSIFPDSFVYTPYMGGFVEGHLWITKETTSVVRRQTWIHPWGRFNNETNISFNNETIEEACQWLHVTWTTRLYHGWITLFKLSMFNIVNQPQGKTLYTRSHR